MSIRKLMHKRKILINGIIVAISILTFSCVETYNGEGTRQKLSFYLENGLKYQIDTFQAEQKGNILQIFDSTRNYKLKISLDSTTGEIEQIKYYMLAKDGDYHLQQHVSFDSNKKLITPNNEYLFFTYRESNGEMQIIMHTDYYDEFKCFIGNDTLSSNMSKISSSTLFRSQEEIKILCKKEVTMEINGEPRKVEDFREVNLVFGLLKRISELK